MNRVLLLGASGFIGSAVLKELLLEPSITHIDALQHKTPINPHNSSQLRIHQGSIETTVFDQIKNTSIIHVARQSSRFRGLGRLFSAYDGMRKNKILVQHFLNTPMMNKLTYISGSLMYGNSNWPITESNRLSPISFAKQYYWAEKPFLKASNHIHKVQMLRVPWVFGNGSWFKSFYLDFIKVKNKIPLYGQGQNVMTFIDQEDLARLIVKVHATIEEPLLNLYMPDYITQEQFAQSLGDILGLPIERISDNEMGIRYEKAVREAFSSNIILSSDDQEKQKDLFATLRYKNVQSMLLARLPSFYY